MTMQRITRGPYASQPLERQAALIAQYAPFPMFRTEGVEQMIATGALTWTYTGEETAITNENDPSTFTGQCSACGRGDWADKIAHSLDEAVEFGWLTPVAEVDA